MDIFDEEVDATPHFAYFSFSHSVGLATATTSIRNDNNTNTTDKEEAICAACRKHDMQPLYIRSTNTNMNTCTDSPSPSPIQTTTQTVVEVCVCSPKMLLAHVEIGLERLVQEIITLEHEQHQYNQDPLRVVCDPMVHECEIPLLKHQVNDQYLQLHDMHLTYEKFGFVVLPRSSSASASTCTSKQAHAVDVDVHNVEWMHMLAHTRGVVLQHIQRTLDLVERVKTLDPSNKIKFQEVMQRDVGRFDMDLSLLRQSELNDFYRFVSSRSDGDGRDGSNGGGRAGSSAPWLPLLDQLLGSEWELKRMGVVTSTGGNLTKQQHWHADGPEQMASQTAVCCFLPLVLDHQPLSNTTGYTTFWSGTHNDKQQPLLAYNVPTKMPPESFYRGMLSFGDVLLYDYKVIHRGEANRMKEGELRPIMYIVYSKPGFEETNFTNNSIHDILGTC
jgi:hypothetical protein